MGRFLQVDPIEGGVDNNYVYPPDGVNDFDLTGLLSPRSVLSGISALGRRLTSAIRNDKYRITTGVPSREGIPRALDYRPPPVPLRPESVVLREKLALEEAMKNATRRHDPIKFKRQGDPRYPDDAWQKMKCMHYGLDGIGIEIHYMRAIYTGYTEDYKVKGWNPSQGSGRMSAC